MTVTRRRFMYLAVTLVALNTFFWLATTGLALPRAVVNEFFGNRMVRAEVILQAPGGTQDWLIDRGTITSVAAGTLTIREADGRTVAVPIDPAAQIRGPHRFSSVARLRPRLRVVVYHQANAPAQLVQVEAAR
jgi:hypothetical protein